MRRFLVAFFVCLGAGPGTAQTWPDHRWDNWIFGAHNGWHFEQGACVPLEGSGAPVNGPSIFSISNPWTGELCFYGAPDTLRDRNGDPFTTCICPEFGYGGGAMLVCPAPGAGNLYYLFYNISYEDPWPDAAYSERYAIIDMDLNGGLGDVVSYDHLVGDSINSIGLVPAVTNDTLWLYANSCDNTAGDIYRYAITAAGVGPAEWSAATYPGWGGGQQLISNRAGDRLFYKSPNGDCRLFRVEAATGTLYDPVDFGVPFATLFNEFSPDGSKLYLWRYNDSPRLEQYDISSWDATTILNSVEVVFASDTTIFWGQDVRLGPDDRIYVSYSHPDSTSLGVINHPNLSGAACDYQPYTAPLSHGVVSAQARFFPPVYWPHPVGNTAGLTEAAPAVQLAASPNPAQNHVTLRLPPHWMTGGPLHVEWQDMSGRPVRREVFAPQRELTLPCAGLAPGLYEVRVTTAQGHVGRVRVAHF